MIPLLSSTESLKRFHESRIAELVGDPELAAAMSKINVFRALLHNPPVAAAQAGLASVLMNSKTLDSRIRELVILRTAWRAGCEYEFCQHIAVGRRVGMNDDEMLGVRDPHKYSGYSDIDRAVIQMADELHDDACVSKATWLALGRSFSHAERIELMFVAGYWRMMAALLVTAEIPLDPIDPTVTRWPEDRTPETRADKHRSTPSK